MNLTQILNVTLPEPPAAKLRDRFPRVYPNMIAKDHYEREGHMVHIILPDGPSHFFRFSPPQYELIKLFDGRRSYKEIANVFTQTQKIAINEDFVRTFADNMEKKEFWYRTPQEESITLFNKLAGDRHKTLQKKHGKSAAADLAIIELIYFDPDKYLGWMYSKIKFVYSTWFTLFSFAMVGVMCAILGVHWDEVWADSVKFYNFTEKGLVDLVEFFAIFALLGAVHETAHGMTCKHFGGESHKMGAFLMYLMPGVFCDVTQIYVYGGRWPRICTLLAGVWSEIIIVTWVTIFWWLSPVGSWWHDFAYKLILSGGIFVVIINLNPLARMDGYYIFCELTRHFDLKGNSTALLSNMVRKFVFRMPAVVPVLPWRRKLFFMSYALVAGLYSYMLLLFFVRISYRILYNYTPEWAFIPSGMLAFMIFRSRIKKLMAFLKSLYLDKRELAQTYWRQIAAVTAVLLVLGSIPVFRDSVDERFLLEPVERVTLRATEAGMVTEMRVTEGQHVEAGDTIAVLRDLKLESEAARTQVDYREANARSVQAGLKYASFGEAEQERLRLTQAQNLIRDRQERLVIKSPIAGRVTTPRLANLEGSHLKEGELVAEVADTRHLRAEVFVPEADVQKLQAIDHTVLRMDATWTPMRAEVESLSLVSRPLEPGLLPVAKYKGIHAPVYYVLRLKVPNAEEEFRAGMTGTARIYGQRRSALGLLLRPSIEAVARRLW
ncbi:MAG TPA: HlyD family efflux transporter periplasmic adaptor subunit [Terriglobales bacterium]|nr:HlyD family efflux transporter periplasmic adaptor subunit [Terriglobales bacterium]